MKELIKEKLKGSASIFINNSEIIITFNKIPPIPRELLTEEVLTILARSFIRLVALSASIEPILKDLNFNATSFAKALRREF